MSINIIWAKDLPNIIVILTDDQGYNDLSCYGSKTIKTPRIDQMAEDGLKLTSFFMSHLQSVQPLELLY